MITVIIEKKILHHVLYITLLALNLIEIRVYKREQTEKSAQFAEIKSF